MFRVQSIDLEEKFSFLIKLVSYSLKKQQLISQMLYYRKQFRMSLIIGSIE